MFYHSIEISGTNSYFGKIQITDPVLFRARCIPTRDLTADVPGTSGEVYHEIGACAVREDIV